MRIASHVLVWSAASLLPLHVLLSRVTQLAALLGWPSNESVLMLPSTRLVLLLLLLLGLSHASPAACHLPVIVPKPRVAPKPHRPLRQSAAE